MTPNLSAVGPIRITIDVEIFSESGTNSDFTKSLEPLMLALDQIGVKATFFVVGSLSQSWKKDLNYLVQNKHEVALHGYTHEHLSKLGPKRFAEDLLRGKRTLEDVIGKEVIGFRAPFFSLTKTSLWAPEILYSAGFKFSSSVLPAWNPQAGFPQAPKKPFLWDCGLVEFPVPTFGISVLRAPLLGGAYLRLSPHVIFQVAHYLGRRRDDEWAYCHPYDFDVNAKFEEVREFSWIVSKLLFSRRKLMLPRVLALTEGGPSDSFESRINNQQFRKLLKVFPKNKSGSASTHI